MHVVDYFSAGGYNTELLSRIVGPQGKVIAYNNAAVPEVLGREALEERYGNDRLPNVAQLTTPPEDAPFEPASLDAALFVHVVPRSVLAREGRLVAEDRSGAGAGEARRRR